MISTDSASRGPSAIDELLVIFEGKSRFLRVLFRFERTREQL